jgi:hypothetical protein
MSEKKQTLKNKDLSESWSKTVPETAKFFNVDPKKGLSDDQVVEIRQRHGFNELPAEERLSYFLIS